MKVTVCELPNEPGKLENAWDKLCQHTKKNESELVLLPEMPFYPWLAHTQNVRKELWEKSVKAHDQWTKKFPELGSSFVASTNPVVNDGDPQNTGFLWDSKAGKVNIHTKYYLPDEPGYWEATWYQRGEKEFSGFKTDKGSLGFLICTEMGFWWSGSSGCLRVLLPFFKPGR